LNSKSTKCDQKQKKKWEVVLKLCL
jgi:hypothetical protein